MDQEFNPGDNAPGTETSQQKSQLLEKMGALGGRAVEGVKSGMGKARKKLAAVPGEVKELIREAEEDNQELYDAISPDNLIVDEPDKPQVPGGLLGKAGNYLRGRKAVRGLQPDYSTRGTTEQRYWLDNDHYIVFDPNSPDDRAEAETAIDNFKNFGTVSGTRGEVNAVIEAGEVELSTRQKDRISPETRRKIDDYSGRLAKGGEFLDKHRIFPEDEEDLEDDLDFDEEETVPRRKAQKAEPGQFTVPKLKSMGLDGRTTYSDSEMFGNAGKIRGVETPGSDRDVIGRDPGKIRIGRSPTDRELLGGGPGRTIPQIQGDSMRNQEKSSWGTPGTFVIPSLDEILPRIESHQSAAPQRQQAPRQRAAAAQPQRQQQSAGPITYRVPRLDDIMPRIDMGMGSPRSQQSVAAPPPKKPSKPKRQPAAPPKKPKKEVATPKVVKKPGKPKAKPKKPVVKKIQPKKPVTKKPVSKTLQKKPLIKKSTPKKSTKGKGK